MLLDNVMQDLDITISQEFIQEQPKIEVTPSMSIKDIQHGQYRVLYSNPFCSIFGLNEKEEPISIEGDKIYKTDDLTYIIDDFDNIILGISHFNIFITSTFRSNIILYHSIFKLLNDAKEGQIIDMYINSPGGDINTGLGVVSYMEQSKAKIRTIVSNFAASMGAMVWASGDELLATPRSILMFHSVQCFGGGHVNKYYEDSKVIKMINENFLKRLVDKHIVTEEEYEEMLKGKDLYFLGKDIMQRISSSSKEHNE